MTDTLETDIAIVGAGIAGVGLAAEVTGDYRVVLLEQESRPAYHSSGRSLAIFLRNYGNAVIRVLNAASAPMFDNPDRQLFPTSLIRQRGALFVANEEGLGQHEKLLASADGLQPMSADEAVAMVPILRRDAIAAAAYEADAQDIDVNTLFEGWLRKARAAGAAILTDTPLLRAERVGGKWRIETPKATIVADVLVNAAGAWADTVATRCGLKPLGIQPLRRSVAILPAPENFDSSRWPLVDDSAESWYFKPEAGKLYVSPSEETPVDAHDAYADDMILAEGLHRFEQATTYTVTRMERSWAGLRSFAPDRTPVVGFAQDTGFFWLAGQGGYGIQTSPALSRLAGQLIRRAEPDPALLPILDHLSPNRFSTEKDFQ
jgi:D-arginine dehydrogenase